MSWIIVDRTRMSPWFFMGWISNDGTGDWTTHQIDAEVFSRAEDAVAAELRLADEDGYGHSIEVQP